MSKTLKRVLISSAALLMMASTGIASAGNVNVNARRRHHRRSTYVYHAPRRHRSRRHKTTMQTLPAITHYAHHHRKPKVRQIHHKRRKKSWRVGKAVTENNDNSLTNSDPNIPLYINDQTPSDEQDYLKQIDNDPKITGSNKRLINQLYNNPEEGGVPNVSHKKQGVAEDDDGATGDLVYDDGNGGSDSNPYSDNTQASDTTPSDTNSDTPSDQQANAENAMEEAQEQADEKVDQEREQQQAAQEEAAQKAQEAKEQAEQKLEEHNQKLNAARAAAQVSPSQAYAQAQQGKESSQDEKLAAARDAANNAVNNAMSPMDALKAAEQKKGQSHDQKLALAREEATLNKQAEQMTNKNINDDIGLLIARGDFNNMSKQEYTEKIAYLKQHPNAVLSLIHNNNLGAVVYAKDPQAAVNFARKAAKKHPELKHKKILATNSKAEANKLALLQADFNKMAKQQGIKLPKGSVFVINAQ